MMFADFFSYIDNYDIICLTETKLDEFDPLIIPNFTAYKNNRQNNKRASGGVAILVKNYISEFVDCLDYNFNETIWIKISGRILQRPLILCTVYNPPQGSPYENMEVFDFIENTISDLKSVETSCDVCIAGDFNARTAQIPEFIADNFCSHHQYVADIFENFLMIT